MAYQEGAASAGARALLIEPDVAERWEMPDGTTYVFHLRHGVKWQNKPPVNGRELVAEDVPFTFHRFLAEQANPLRYMLESVDRVGGLGGKPRYRVVLQNAAWTV